MSRHRIAIIGLGMAVTPHAKSLLDLEDRVEVVYAMTPSAVRRQSFADRFAFPTTDSLERIVDDRSITAAAVLTPPDVISQASLAIPLMALYEGAIVAVRMVEKKAAAAQASTTPPPASPPPKANPAE